VELKDFLGAEWLRGNIDDGATAQSRMNVGTYFEWGGDWYLSTANLEKLFDFLSAEAPLMDDEAPFPRQDGRTRPDLLDELSESTGDSDRAAWMGAVETEAYWSVPANQEAYWAVPENRYDEPVLDGSYGMRYRYDRREEVYEWEDPPDSETWLSQEEADELVQARQQPAVPPAAAAQPTEPTWDENWEMLYRTNERGVYEYAYSDDRKTIRPGTRWLSYEDVTRGADPSVRATATPEKVAAITTPVTPQGADEIVQTVVAEIGIPVLEDIAQSDAAIGALDAGQREELLAELLAEIASGT
jgi:hypothetical protein